MSKKYKNPLSVVFGRVLQDFRKKQSQKAEDISQRIGVGPSAYRMIESGYANLNPARALELISIEWFQEIKYEKLAKLLTGIQILEPVRSDAETLMETMRQLLLNDGELARILVDIDDFIGGTPERLENYLERDDVVEMFKEYLTTIDVLVADNISAELDEIKALAPCTLSPMVTSICNQIQIQLDSIKSIGGIRDEVTNLAENIESIKRHESGFLEKSALKWRNDHKFKSTEGIFRDYANLSSNFLMDRFSDNLKQLWFEDFKKLGYLIIADKKDIPTVKKHITKFKEVLEKLFREKFNLDGSYEGGLSKVSFGIVDPNSPTLKDLGLQDNSNELWFYEDTKQYKYTFETVKAESLTYNNESLEKGTEKYDKTTVIQYNALTNAQVEFFFKSLETIWKQATIIKL